MSTGIVVLAFLGLFGGLQVVGLVAMLMNRVLRPLREIERYAADILDSGLGIGRNLEAIDEAVRLRDLATALPGAVRKAVE
jgi:hypothetical protein